MKTNIRGVGVALVTPFTDEDGVDFAALDKLIERVIGGGADYLVALGTTAETPALSGSEKEAILRFVVERSAGRVPVIAGLGGNSTADVVSALRSANLDGVDAVLSVTPYYNKPSQEGIYRHYKALAEASPCGIVLYNVPGRTGVNMTAQTVLRLAHDCGNIIGVKERQPVAGGIHFERPSRGICRDLRRRQFNRSDGGAGRRRHYFGGGKRVYR